MSDRVLVTLERVRPVGMVPSAVHLSRFPFVIGRGPDCDLRLFDPAVSRRHCRLDWHDGRLVVEDLDSRNGTLVNAHKITEPRPLDEGDSLWLGGALFDVRLHARVPAGERCRVLVVEDDADVATTLAVLLRGWGHEVEVAGDGREALEAARAHPPDAVLLDLHLGDGPDGLEVAHRLRDEAGIRDARLVAVTGRPPESVGETGEFDTVLLKPVDARALREALAVN
jgi:CheY-like chemotaxis protein